MKQEGRTNKSLQIKEDFDVDSKSRTGQPNSESMEEIRMLHLSACLQGIQKKKERGGGNI